MRPYRRAAAVMSLTVGALISAVAHAQTPPSDGTATGGGQAPASGSNLLNPNISAIGWFQGTAGDPNDAEGSSAFELREAELGFQATVDPYSRADFFVAVSPEEGADLEEGTLTFLTLPAGLTAKLGKFRSNFGKFNRTHPPETPFTDRPLAAERFLGEEGLTGVGASASWLAPLPFYFNVDAEISTTPDAGASPAFEAYRGKDLLYLARASTFFDLTESMNLTAGATVADGANGSAPPTGSAVQGDPRRALLYGADVTFRWKNPRRAIYRSLTAQAEWMQRRAVPASGPDEVRSGGFAYFDLQFARRWHAGARYDWSDSLGGTETDPATGVLGFVTFNPSEFASLSLQVRDQALEDPSQSGDPVFFLKTTFSIGPHGQHPF